MKITQKNVFDVQNIVLPYKDIKQLVATFVIFLN